MIDVEKREKVIFAIENCLTTDSVTECRKMECPFISCRESCLEWLLRSALSLLKEQDAEIKRQKRFNCEHANRDSAGCLGYCGCEQDDEPIDACKQCEKYTGNICAEY